MFSGTAHNHVISQKDERTLQLPKNRPFSPAEFNLKLIVEHVRTWAYNLARYTISEPMNSNRVK